MSKNIVLVGLSGSGKTTIGKLLQKVFADFVLIDTDEIIVKKENRSINDIFANDGETYFRKVETEVTKEVSAKENQIISTGGGIVLNKQNITELKKNGIIFYLKTSPDTLIKRLQGDTTRPLLKTDDIKAKLVSMLEIRGKLYEKADFTTETDNLSEDETVKEITRIYNERSNG
ncbi:MAG: shikimate kinase [Candidatus Gastranaerophilales bacterium]|nr:shikimate kinase [Candidatus Gastranaerophilales bacterium]